MGESSQDAVSRFDRSHPSHPKTRIRVDVTSRKRGRPSTIPEELKAELIELAKSGRSPEEIANAYGLSRWAVYRWLRKHR